jgi:hypothetical protein
MEIDKFRHQLGDILFDLRQDANLSEHKQLLTKIQLYIHEFDEGDRDRHEVYIAAQAAIDSIEPVKKYLPTKFDVFSQASEPDKFDATSASSAPELSPELLVH